MVRDAATGPASSSESGNCPYGIAACWGGANEALRSLDGVQYVDPIPDGDRSTATVYLEDEGCPRWITGTAIPPDGPPTYLLRGVEVTLNGTVDAREGVLVLAGEGRRPPVS